MLGRKRQRELVRGGSSVIRWQGSVASFKLMIFVADDGSLMDGGQGVGRLWD